MKNRNFVKIDILAKNQYLTEILILVKNQYLTKIKIFIKNQYLTEIEIVVKSRNFGQKSKILIEIEIFHKNLNSVLFFEKMNIKL